MPAPGASDPEHRPAGQEQGGADLADVDCWPRLSSSTPREESARMVNERGQGVKPAKPVVTRQRRSVSTVPDLRAADP
jgi:hypothetical protein